MNSWLELYEQRSYHAFVFFLSFSPCKGVILNFLDKYYKILSI